MLNGASGWHRRRQNPISDRDPQVTSSTPATRYAKMSITSSGNVGIGTTNPGAKLEVNGAESNTEAMILSGNVSNWPALRLGRTARELAIAISSGPGSWVTGSVAGDTVFRTDSGNYLFGGNGGAPLFAIQNGGNVGIGTASPIAKLQSDSGVGGVATIGAYVHSSTGGGTFTDAAGHVRSTASLVVGSQWGTNNADSALLNVYAGNTDGVLYVKTNGNIGIGTTTPGARLDVKSSGTGYGSGLRLIASANSNTWDILNSGGDLYLGYNSGGGNPEHVFKANGNVGIGTTSPRGRLDVVGPAGTSAWPLNIDSQADLGGGAYRLVAFYSNGTYRADIIWNGSQIVYNTSSDYRLKENIRPIQNPLERVMRLPVHQFNMKDNPHKDVVDGFLAHEVQAVAPYAASGTKDAVDAAGKPIYQSVDYGKLTPLLAGAIQELKADNDSLHGELKVAQEQIKAANDNHLEDAKAIEELRREIEALKEPGRGRNCKAGAQ